MRSIVIAMLLAACGNNADKLGVGAQCGTDTDCNTDLKEKCLAFKGGYCGLEGCVHDTDCPADSACIAHTDGHNYCFRICVDKTECNENRDATNESNCSANITFVDGANNRKACVPPS